MNTMKAKWDGDGIFSSKDWTKKANKFNGDNILSSERIRREIGIRSS